MCICQDYFTGWPGLLEDLHRTRNSRKFNLEVSSGHRRHLRAASLFCWPFLPLQAPCDRAGHLSLCPDLAQAHTGAAGNGESLDAEYVCSKIINSIIWFKVPTPVSESSGSTVSHGSVASCSLLPLCLNTPCSSLCRPSGSCCTAIEWALEVGRPGLAVWFRQGAEPPWASFSHLLKWGLDNLSWKIGVI